jgi:hypothetical protein
LATIKKINGTQMNADKCGKRCIKIFLNFKKIVGLKRKILDSCFRRNDPLAMASGGVQCQKAERIYLK